MARWLAVAVVLAALATACGDDGDGSADQDTTMPSSSTSTVAGPGQSSTTTSPTPTTTTAAPAVSTTAGPPSTAPSGAGCDSATLLTSLNEVTGRGWASVTIEACAEGAFAHVWGVPADPQESESEQYLLDGRGGSWLVTDEGTGLVCGDFDLSAAGREACAVLYPDLVRSTVLESVVEPGGLDPIAVGMTLPEIVAATGRAVRRTEGGIDEPGRLCFVAVIEGVDDVDVWLSGSDPDPDVATVWAITTTRPSMSGLGVGDTLDDLSAGLPGGELVEMAGGLPVDLYVVEESTGRLTFALRDGVVVGVGAGSYPVEGCS